jgi:hypothetical protein
MFSSGGSVGTSTTVDIGAGAQAATASESNVWEIMPAGATFGHFYCSSQKPTGGTSFTFTLRQTVPSGGSFTTTNIATCMVVAGAVNGSTTASITLVAGDIYDVQVATGNIAGGVSAGIGP